MTDTEHPISDDEARALLEHALAVTDLTPTQFARVVLWREGRTVYRWLAGESPMPVVVRQRLAWFVNDLSSSARARLIRLLLRSWPPGSRRRVAGLGEHSPRAR